ncbi:hypothetical protein CA54_53560 [Symmachiella macrocystis]|uniref:Uncharacterized protein n=1 Tax=Symmachiella macrocystis TaxID=2527985 RepID=A0A5C6B5U3_9PLAN|nr:hypothetical protein CA54_53560 [Symmachiella macrocystis]
MHIKILGDDFWGKLFTSSFIVTENGCRFRIEY